MVELMSRARSGQRMVTLHKGGTAETQVPLDALAIPDLWPAVDKVADKSAREAILEVWSIAHSLLHALRD